MMDNTSPQDDLRAHLVELYARFLTAQGTQPADHFLGGYLRRRREIRGSARHFLGAVFFALLRQRVTTLLLSGWKGEADREGRFVPMLLPPGGEAIRAVTRWLRQDMVLDASEARDKALTALNLAKSRPPIPGETSIKWPENPGGEIDSINQALDAPGDHVPGDLLPLLGGVLPPLLFQRWEGRFGREEALALHQVMAKPGALDLRINPECLSREDLLSRLASHEVPAEPTPHSPDGIRILRKGNLRSLEDKYPGAWEVQNEASQIVTHALGDIRGMRVIDACAGAGGKSLHLAARVGPEGRVFAHDIDPARLDRIKPRMARGGIGNIEILNPGGVVETAPYDAVLIDAPCLGFGRLGRDPVASWRAPFPRMLDRTVREQAECLRVYMPLVRPGGILVYAVCSFEPEETTEMLEGLEGFAPDPLPQPLDGPPFAATRSPDGSSVVILPSQHGTDGFFIARMRRKSD